MPFQSTLQYFSLQSFPDHYRQGCELWERALLSQTLPFTRLDFTLSPQDNLLCQTGWIGDLDAKAVLVVIGGTHGIEGFTGTAVQVDWMQMVANGLIALPDHTAMLMINALNPWGYANNRRCDDQGIDVNRNFIDFSQPLPINTGYEELQPLFGIRDRDARVEALQDYCLRVGQRPYEIALSGGQFNDPAGPFYGGQRPGFSRGVIESLIRHYLLANRRLAVVDVHTGLGPYGYGEVICDHPLGTDGLMTAIEWFGPGCGLPEIGKSSSVPKLGLLDYAWHQVMGSKSCFVTLEFGTLGTAALFDTLIDEASVWSSSECVSCHSKEIVATHMKAHFYPLDAYWREAVIFRARQVLHQALVGVS